MGAIEGGAGTSGKGQPYRCFLVRCRLVEGAGEGKPTVSPADAGSRAVVWRFTVEQVRPDAARRSFASIHDVAAYIEAELVSCTRGRKVVP